MSYLSQLIHGRITAAQALAKSAKYLKEKLGVTVSDASVDKIVKATDDVTDKLEETITGYLTAHFPALPAAIAVAATTAALNTIDAAVAGAGAVIKDAN